MISPETIRMYTFFSGLTNEQIVYLASNAHLIEFKPEQYFFHEDETLTQIYIVQEGKVAITTKVPDPEAEHKTSQLLAGEMLQTKEIKVSIIESGGVFGWSALIPPYQATANAKGLTNGKAIQFDAEKLRVIFEEDPQFGYKMILKLSQILRNRFDDLRTETLFCFD